MVRHRRILPAGCFDDAERIRIFNTVADRRLLINRVPLARAKKRDTAVVAVLWVTLE